MSYRKYASANPADRAICKARVASAPWNGPAETTFKAVPPRVVGCTRTGKPAAVSADDARFAPGPLARYAPTWTHCAGPVATDLEDRDVVTDCVSANSAGASSTVTVATISPVERLINCRGTVFDHTSAVCTSPSAVPRPRCGLNRPSSNAR